jgi:hypothetical protein
LQRNAAQLIAHIPALKTNKHVGHICDVLDQAGIDPARWTGRDIARELTTDTQTRGWVWPTQLTRPTAFLRWRLTHIDWSHLSPPNAPATTIGSVSQNKQHVDARRASGIHTSPTPELAPKSCNTYASN